MSGAARCASDAASQSARRYVKGRHDLSVTVALISDKTALESDYCCRYSAPAGPDQEIADVDVCLQSRDLI